MSDDATEVQPPAQLTLASHPRAGRSIRRVRAMAGLAALALTLLLSLRAGVPAWDATARALMAGIAVHLIAWRISVTVWKQLLLAEMRAAYDRRVQRARRRAELARGEM